MKYEENDFQGLKKKTAEFMLEGPFKELFERYDEYSVYKFANMDDMLERLRIHDVRKEFIDYLYKISRGKKRGVVEQTEELIKSLWEYGCPNKGPETDNLRNLAADICEMVKAVDYWEWEQMRQIGESDADVIRKTCNLVQEPDNRYELLEYFSEYQGNQPMRYKDLLKIGAIIVSLNDTLPFSEKQDTAMERALLESNNFLEIEAYDDATIHFILRQKWSEDDSYIVFAEYEEERALCFNPYTQQIHEEESLDDCTSDEKLFALLENGYEIMLMTAEGHMGVWYEVGKEGIDAVRYKEGLDKYLEYCSENHISADILAATMHYATPDLFALTEQRTGGADKAVRQEKQPKCR